MLDLHSGCIQTTNPCPREGLPGVADVTGCSRDCFDVSWQYQAGILQLMFEKILPEFNEMMQNLAKKDREFKDAAPELFGPFGFCDVCQEPWGSIQFLQSVNKDQPGTEKRFFQGGPLGNRRVYSKARMPLGFKRGDSETGINPTQLKVTQQQVAAVCGLRTSRVGMGVLITYMSFITHH